MKRNYFFIIFILILVLLLVAQGYYSGVSFSIINLVEESELYEIEQLKEIKLLACESFSIMGSAFSFDIALKFIQYIPKTINNDSLNDVVSWKNHIHSPPSLFI